MLHGNLRAIIKSTDVHQWEFLCPLCDKWHKVAEGTFMNHREVVERLTPFMIGHGYGSGGYVSFAVSARLEGPDGV